jgi:integrase
MLGLRRSDIDTLRGTVSVARQVQEIAGQRVLVDAAKTDAGRRVVALPASVMSELVEHMSRYSQPGQSGAVFTNPEGGPVRRASLYAAFQEACAKVGAPPGLHIHDLRHHAATVMARMPGITTKELMSRIGHKSPRAALIYQHATQERDKAIADFLDAQLAGVDRRQDAAVIDMPRRQSTN